MLILAAVSIATLTGQNGILTRADDTKEQTEVASVKEQAQLDISNWVASELKNGRNGIISDWEEIKNILDTANPDIENRYYTDVTEEGVVTPNGYLVPIEELYTNNSTGGDLPEFDENTLIGEAINTNKYGYIVPEYTVKTSEMTSNVWKLFYQDSNYTYLITDEVVGSYKPSDYYNGKFVNGSYVSTIGQKLNPMLLEAGTIFTENNKNKSILATAWLTDTSEMSMWNEYKNSDAVFAIGSPTAELYVASFNATASENSAKPITLEVETNGYTHNTKSGQLKTRYNYGIYNKGTSFDFWIASPHYYIVTDDFLMDDSGYFIGADVSYVAKGVCPIVCIQTSVFNEKYKLSIPE